MDEAIGQQSSYLSSNVKKLVCLEPDDPVQKKHCDNLYFLNEDGLLNWDAVWNTCSLNECFSQDGVSNYSMAVSRLYPVSCQVHASISQLTTEEFQLKYENHLKWTTKTEQLLQCFNLLKSPQPGCLVTSLLLLTPTLERILGDIFMTCADDTITCPSLLKDLLKTQELRSVLGGNFMLCLEVYIGSPNGLNLRNLAWHGFLSKGELPAHYVSFLLMLSLSLAETAKLQTKQLNFDKLNERPLIKYSDIAAINDIFPNIVLSENSSELVSRGYFVTASMVQLWYLARDFFQQERYDYVVMILLPQLEHSLRRLYASVNEMPERVQTAESAEFYTTFNEILAPELADGTRNKLLDSLEPYFIELLLDVLVHPEGPRLRDHMSHGEVDILRFPKSLANHILGIAIAFCVRFCPDKMTEVDKFWDISKAVQDYSSVFHPFSCFRREYSALVGSLLDWDNLNQPCEDEFRQKCCEDVRDVMAWDGIINTILQKTSFVKSSTGTTQGYSYREARSLCDENVLRMMLRLLDDCELDTLFRPRYELEVVALLRQVTGHCTRTSDQIQQTSKARYSEWEQKTLRSRQRNNYKRFWFYLPFIGQTLCLLAVVVVGEFSQIKSMTGSDVKKNKFLKKCLQCSENLASLSSSSRNRWLECKENSKVWLEQVFVYYDQQNV